MDVVALSPEDGIFGHRKRDIGVAGQAAADAVPPLSTQTQRQTVGRAFGDGHGQIATAGQGDARLRTPSGIEERHLQAVAVILSRHVEASAAAGPPERIATAPTAPGEAREEVLRVDAVRPEAGSAPRVPEARPAVGILRSAGRIAVVAPLRPFGPARVDLSAVEAGARLRVPQQIVGSRRRLEARLGRGIVGIEIRMVRARDPAICLLDLGHRRRLRQSESVIGVVGHVDIDPRAASERNPSPGPGPTKGLPCAPPK